MYNPETIKLGSASRSFSCVGVELNPYDVNVT